jgi:hypothetical protein
MACAVMLFPFLKTIGASNFKMDFKTITSYGNLRLYSIIIEIIFLFCLYMIVLNTFIFRKKYRHNSQPLLKYLTLVVLFLFMLVFVIIEIYCQKVLKSAIEDYALTNQIPEEFKKQ